MPRSAPCLRSSGPRSAGKAAGRGAAGQPPAAWRPSPQRRSRKKAPLPAGQSRPAPVVCSQSPFASAGCGPIGAGGAGREGDFPYRGAALRRGFISLRTWRRRRHLAEAVLRPGGERAVPPRASGRVARFPPELPQAAPSRFGAAAGRRLWLCWRLPRTGFLTTFGSGGADGAAAALTAIKNPAAPRRGTPALPAERAWRPAGPAPLAPAPARPSCCSARSAGQAFLAAGTAAAAALGRSDQGRKVKPPPATGKERGPWGGFVNVRYAVMSKGCTADPGPILLVSYYKLSLSIHSI